MRRTIFLAIAAALLCAPATSAAAVSRADPEDTPYGAPDVIQLVSDSTEDGSFGVATRLIPRPPAGWGACVPFVPGSSTCFPPDVGVDWFLELDPDGGSAADGGADARVAAVPGAGTTTMELSRWDAARGWVTGPVPQVVVRPVGSLLDILWAAPYAALGIVPGAPVAVATVTRYRTFTGLGVQREYTDRAPDAGALAVTAAGAPAAPSAACSAASRAYGRARAKLRRAKRHGTGVHKARPSLKRRRKALRRACPAPAPATAQPGAAVPGRPSCRYVTRPTYVIGADGRTRLEQRVVVACG